MRDFSTVNDSRLGVELSKNVPNIVAEEEHGMWAHQGTLNGTDSIVSGVILCLECCCT